jgi:SAM-dependent methyltransferase
MNSPFLRYSLDYFERNRPLFESDEFPARPHLRKDKYPLRFLRYWQAHNAIVDYQKQVGRKIDLVDLGCERGLLKLLAGNEIDAHWTGLDWNLSRPSLQRAEYDHLIAADFDKPLDLPDSSADVVVSLHVFEHLPRPEFTAAEVARVLKPGGIFLMGTPVVPQFAAARGEKRYQDELARGKRWAGKHINKFWPERATKLMESAGLKVDWLTGSYFLRTSGHGLENFKPWIRINQAWGAAFPSLGQEMYVQARKPANP